MSKIFIIILFTISQSLFSQEILTGKVVSEGGFIITDVDVINITNGAKTKTNEVGEFSISAHKNDEVRFSKRGYERSSYKFIDAYLPIKVVLLKVASEIEEVKILPLSGNLSNDSKKLTKEDKVQRLRDEIGLPKNPEKPREKPADVKNDILIPLLGIPPTLNVQAIYDVVSGKSRKLKSWYKYEDMQIDIAWVKNNTEESYFVKAGIPSEKISEFIEFSFLIQNQIRIAVKQKNISKATLLFEETIPIYVSRLNN